MIEFTPITKITSENLNDLIICTDWHDMEGHGLRGEYVVEPMDSGKVPQIHYCEVNGEVKMFVLQKDMNDFLLDAGSLVSTT